MDFLNYTWVFSHLCSIMLMLMLNPGLYSSNLGLTMNKMCIKSAPYLHEKSTNLALNMVLFYALVLMLLRPKQHH